MAKRKNTQHIIQNQPSMAAGEIGPELYGRVDQELYYIGLRTCENMIIRQYGGAWNRPGTYFVGEVKDHTKKVCLNPFQFNEEQTYVIEFGDEYLRFVSNGAEIVGTAKVITDITQDSPGVVTAVAHGFLDGEDVYLADIVGMVELNARGVRVANKTVDTFELVDYFGNPIDTSGYSAYVSGGTASRIYETTAPWGEQELFDLNYSQSNDVLTVVHPDYYPQDVTRSANTSWTVSDFANEFGPFKKINTTAITLDPSAVTGGSITIDSSAALFDADWIDELIYIQQMPNDATKRWEPAKSIAANDIRVSGPHYYKASNTATTGTWRPDHTEGTATDGDNGVTWEYLHSGFGIVRVTAVTDSDTITAEVVKRLPENVVATPTDIWARSAWSITEGYPGAVAYHKQRLIFGGTPKQPNALQFSGVGERLYFGKSNPILDDDAFNLSLDSTKQANALRHLIPLKQLIALTTGAEHLINGPNGSLLATDPPFADVQGYTGGSKRQPIIIGNTALFVQEKGTAVRSLQYSLDKDSFAGVNLSARSPHLFQGREVMQWAYQREPLSVVWVILDNGTLLGFTYMEEQQVYAWHRHKTDGFFESVCTISEGEEDAVYFIVRRTVNGETVRYIERLASRYFDTVKDAYFVDCGLSYDGRNYTETIEDKTTDVPVLVREAKTATTVTVSGGTTWDSPETLTITASDGIFKDTDVGDLIILPMLLDGANIVVGLEITAFTSDTEVDCIPNREVPEDLRDTATGIWAFARDRFLPLFHLEGCEVAVLADGNEVEDMVVSNGQVILPNPASVVHIGLPYTARLETLDVAQPQGQLKGKTVAVPKVDVTVQESRDVQVSTSGFSGEFTDYAQRDDSMGYDECIPAQTAVFEVNTSSEWSSKGRIAIRQQRPLPLAVNCISPEVVIGES